VAVQPAVSEPLVGCLPKQVAIDPARSLEEGRHKLLSKIDAFFHHDIVLIYLCPLGRASKIKGLSENG
jgi:hypothetical protein